jgi:hypothetical protein
MNNLQRLTDVIDSLKLHKVGSISNKRTLSPEVLRDVITELKIKRADFLKKNIKELKQKIKQNFKRLKISTFSLMEHDFDKNSHSNILEYLIDYNSFEEGSKILSQMVMDTSISSKNDLRNCP